AAIEAATPRRVQAKTRAANVRAAQEYAANARHLLTVDASRRDLPADARKLARAMLRQLPDDAAFPDLELCGDDAKEYAARCGELAALVARERARDDMRVSLEYFARHADRVETFAEHATEWAAVRSARECLNLIHDAGRRVDDAKASAK